ncbi:hypothetical protein SAMN06265222_101526 [Neorhodopirellula lusitana]|uniref:Uncharacterized protein n=1 Tax=Neorhodopirellula lusitana TaxID=445327 RepID=A0ABY1PP99_9BACT|nr:hypothetical protein SAMN06265222_101526 [Neorhodopirellula lusitana]
MRCLATRRRSSSRRHRIQFDEWAIQTNLSFHRRTSIYLSVNLRIEQFFSVVFRSVKAKLHITFAERNATTISSSIPS